MDRIERPSATIMTPEVQVMESMQRDLEAAGRYEDSARLGKFFPEEVADTRSLIIRLRQEAAASGDPQSDFELFTLMRGNAVSLLGQTTDSSERYDMQRQITILDTLIGYSPDAELPSDAKFLF